MGKAYRYVFYRIYRWALSKHGDRDLPHLTAVFIVTLSMFANLMTVALALAVAGLPIFENGDLSKTIAVVVLVALAAANFRLLIMRHGVERVVNEFEALDPAERSRAGSIVAAYIIGSVCLFFGLATVVAMSRG